MSNGVLECDSYVAELYAYYFVIKDFYVIKKGHYLCWTLYYNIIYYMLQLYQYISV